jgi:hypothetical protein
VKTYWLGRTWQSWLVFLFCALATDDLFSLHSVWELIAVAVVWGYIIPPGLLFRTRR